MNRTRSVSINSAALFAAFLAGLLFLGSCATAPKTAPLSPDPLGMAYLPLAPGGLVYMFVDVNEARPILNRIGLKGMGGRQAAEILDRTQYAVAAVYPKGGSQNVQVAAWGEYPKAGAGISFAFNKNWKKRKSTIGKSYWYSNRNGLSVALSSHQAFAAMGSSGAKNSGDSKNPLDPFAVPPGTPSPEGFSEFRRGAALSLWLENPSVPLNRFFSGMNLPLQIPAEQLLVSLFPVPPDEAESASAGSASASYEAYLRIKTPSPSQARGLVTIFSMARLFAANAAGAGGMAAPSSMTALLPILFANPPVQDGTFLDIRTASMDAEEIALLFSLFSVYSIQN